MRVELTGAEREQLRAVSREHATGERSGPVPSGVAARTRQLHDAIARAHGLHPAEARFCTDPISGGIWIEVGHGARDARAASVARFAEAVDAFVVEDLVMGVDPTADARLRAKVAAGSPILVGERHGIEQNPLVAYTLMRRLNIRLLALEWSGELEPVVDRYLAGHELDVDALAQSRDGRITAGHFAVLRALSVAGLLDRVVLFDLAIWPRTWSERDEGMAGRLLAGTRGTPALAMAGSLHTRLRRHRHGEPMGAHVARTRAGTLEVRLRYPGGGPLSWHGSSCMLRPAGAWLELTVPHARQAVTPGS
ncbi:MAG TPA: hypothetical protein VGO86_12075 [Candidatus Dormibacteraeota bacterium]